MYDKRVPDIINTARTRQSSKKIGEWLASGVARVRWSFLSPSRRFEVPRRSASVSVAGRSAPGL
jgi:hypothetical protein